jgi:hypothetical protein
MRTKTLLLIVQPSSMSGAANCFSQVQLVASTIPAAAMPTIASEAISNSALSACCFSLLAFPAHLHGLYVGNFYRFKVPKAQAATTFV